MRHFRKNEIVAMSVIIVIGLLAKNPYLYAVVGRAEQYEPFKQEDLDKFQASITNEELEQQLATADELTSILNQKQKQAKNLDSENKEILNEEIEKLKVQLLKLPKRDRFQGEMTGIYNFTSNANRSPINSEKNDSQFDLKTGGFIDLSGRKTDLKFGTEYGREWNWEFSENDTQELSQTLSYRRKYFKKIAHSTKTRMGRTNSKTIEINADKIRWDFDEMTAYNYEFSKKLSLNTDFSGNKRLFPQEAFDQDSAWEFNANPSVFWSMTPKSRISAGYNFGVNKIRSKAGNANEQGLKVGYFGKVTRKSSTSFDIAFSHQTPKSLESNKINTVTTGMGYIWQMTPKTQITLQYIRSLQNTTSRLVGGEIDGENETSKEVIHYTNNSPSISVNSRLNRKLTTIISFTPSHLKTKSDAVGINKDSETQQFNFPISVEASYYITPKILLTIRYAFAYRTGDEYNDKVRVHSLDSVFRWVL